MNIEQILTIPNTPSTADSEIYEDTDSSLHLDSLEEGQAALVDYGVYSGMVWVPESPPPFEDPVSWCTKMLPGAGAFYCVNHEDGTPEMGHLDSLSKLQPPL